jgi:hypothetical protein
VKSAVLESVAHNQPPIIRRPQADEGKARAKAAADVAALVGESLAEYMAAKAR